MLTPAPCSRDQGSATDSPAPLPISCYIRTLNEARRIGEVVSVAKSLCDQVVVVDSGSTDGTVDIACHAGADVVRQEWLGNGYQKKVGERNCRHDWLLDLDADEILSPPLIDAIRDAFSGDGPSHDVYQLALTIVDPTGRVWHRSAVSHRAKLYDSRRIQMPNVHTWDQLDLTAEHRVKRLDGPLLHYAFAEIGHLIRKQESAMRSRVKEMPARPPWSVRLRVLVGFPCYFLKYYLIRGCWRTGIYGFSFAGVCAFSRWGRDVKLYERDCVTSDKDSAVDTDTAHQAMRVNRAA